MPLWCRRGREDEKYSGIVWQVKSFEIVTLFHEKKRQISRVRLKLSLFWYSRRQVKKAQSTTGNCNFFKIFHNGECDIGIVFDRKYVHSEKSKKEIAQAQKL